MGCCLLHYYFGKYFKLALILHGIGVPLPALTTGGVFLNFILKRLHQLSMLPRYIVQTKLYLMGNDPLASDVHLYIDPLVSLFSNWVAPFDWLQLAADFSN